MRGPRSRRPARAGGGADAGGANAGGANAGGANAGKPPWRQRTWVPPLVVHCLWISVAALLLIAGSFLLTIGEQGGLTIGGRLITPTPLDIAVLPLAILPLLLPLWGAAIFALTSSPLWTPREKLRAAWLPLICALFLGVPAAVGLASSGVSGMMPLVGLGIMLVLVVSGWVLVTMWRRGAAVALKLAGRVD